MYKQIAQILSCFLIILTICDYNNSKSQVLAQLYKRQKPPTPPPTSLSSSSAGPGINKHPIDNVVAEMQVVCHSDSIELKMNTNNPFNGMVYAKDAPNNNKCVAEYNSLTNMTFRLPLKSCGTLFAEGDDGIEYFNTVVVQPHMRLMTNQGKGYHIRCKYQTRERTIANTHFNVSASFQMQNNPQAMSTPLVGTASMPSCSMKIFRSGRDDVAEAVKIGDKLIMVIEIDQQDMYGMRITNCVVRDGSNIAEQQLIDDLGCPVDENIMPKFEYTNNSTRAAVSFPAHKFPHTSSVYYQCNVRLCINNGGCTQIECSQAGSGSSATSGQRHKRFVANHEHLPQPLALNVSPQIQSSKKLDKQQQQQQQDMSFDVYSGLYVSDIDIADSGSSDKNSRQVVIQPRESETLSSSHSSTGSSLADPAIGELCLSYGQAGLLLLMASLATMGVFVMLVCQLGFVSSPRNGEGIQTTVSSGGAFLSPHFAATRRYYRSGNRDFYGQAHLSNSSHCSHDPVIGN